MTTTSYKEACQTFVPRDTRGDGPEHFSGASRMPDEQPDVQRAVQLRAKLAMHLLKRHELQEQLPKVRGHRAHRALMYAIDAENKAIDEINFETVAITATQKAIDEL